MPGGELTVLTTKMYVQDAPRTQIGHPKSPDLFQGPDRVDYHGYSGRGTAGDLPDRIYYPVCSLKWGS